MSKPRRKFSREFKLKTIELSYSRENVADLAKELGLRPGLIYRWRSELASPAEGSDQGSSDTKSVSLREVQRENRELKKQLLDRDLELQILKKAISIFSKRDG